ncbi:MAG: UDP-N-acetylmuramoyl-L-alanine--D-glutamate ligase [Bacillota bacterium]|nr:UDP-N-acetylmuramoyl-L-alanine--D-glutamate ligase [Bacillota bacterium]
MRASGRQALVIGMGKSGIAAAIFLRNKGMEVTICDDKDSSELKDSLKKLEELDLKIITGGYPAVTNDEYHFIFVSPGVPLNVEPVKSAHQVGLPVLGELELLAEFCKAPVVAITGTNGKTTTTALTGELLNDGRRRVVVGGNIGTTILEQMGEITANSIVVAEVSSFQLETTDAFKPKVAIILNVTPDHLDRHLTYENYLAAKSRIFQNQDKEDFLIINYDQLDLRQLGHIAKGKVIFFSRVHILEEGVFVLDNNIVARLNGMETVICPIEKIRIKGSHNLENSLAAIAAAIVVGVDLEHINLTVASFPGVAHRLEPVAEINGVQYINDSKGTNPDATDKALAAFDQPIILIAGGKDKGSSFEELLIKNSHRIKAIVVIGETTPQIITAAIAAGIKKVKSEHSFENAVTTASSLAAAGDVVLLSPACASWDMFKNYEERGDLFKKLVMELRG